MIISQTDRMVYKIEESGRSFITHWFINMLAALKDVDLSEKIDVCFDLDFTKESYQKESLDILSDIINVVPNTSDAVFLKSNKTINSINGGGFHKDPRSYVFLRELFLSRIILTRLDMKKFISVVISLIFVKEMFLKIQFVADKL